MERYSSNLTLFYVIFLPVFTWVFLLASTLGAFLGPVLNSEIYISDYTRYAVLALLILMSVFNIFFALRLKRLEADDEKIYISNYFKHTVMPIDNIRSVMITDLFIMRIVRVQFVKRSYWGHTIKVLERENLLQKYCEAHQIPVVKRPG